MKMFLIFSTLCIVITASETAFTQAFCSAPKKETRKEKTWKVPSSFGRDPITHHQLVCAGPATIDHASLINGNVLAGNEPDTLLHQELYLQLNQNNDWYSKAHFAEKKEAEPSPYASFWGLVLLVLASPGEYEF